MSHWRTALLFSACVGWTAYPALASPADCGEDIAARQLAQLVRDDPAQRRPRLVCDALLSAIAADKAREMAELQRVSHLGRNGANRRLMDAGYPLARIYPRLLENNVEAVAGGLDDADAAWAAFRASADHRSHLLGEHPFYQLQDEIGVGHHVDRATPHVHYWVVYVAHRDGEAAHEGRAMVRRD